MIARAYSRSSDDACPDRLSCTRRMGSSRFLKAVRGRHRQGALVVKVFVKQDPSISLKPFVRRLKGALELLCVPFPLC